ncbi:uncharacterized protein AMSG_05131 [Thecamonas trahens ATCC 50062]|uniref:Uncharacterized protein n=1 Tax=Thecamonas trahens ATCC 50062 TaxID=461836 RepID=A0A0L0D9Y6_THETB|nr:hypothetical protein AMSG_05131 [Thecamonas trahens ATCC 50062]KNC49154.1 hypothetical protein AMSG_05131 [Thecamonas trahens ATCC 50062]|eukprot:XP_013758176.1 hypothetical protein AMSG_05131 [Thecamonas trahens ATCC 50062]
MAATRTPAADLPTRLRRVLNNSILGRSNSKEGAELCAKTLTTLLRNNKIKARIADIDGGVDYLYLAGFRRVVEDHEEVLRWPFGSPDTDAQVRRDAVAVVSTALTILTDRMAAIAERAAREKKHAAKDASAAELERARVLALIEDDRTRRRAAANRRRLPLRK